MKYNNKKGFTLIELLVVIAIIGILSGLIIVTMSGATTSANDAKRKSNLDTIRKALMYTGALNGNTFPISTSLCNIGSNCPSTLTTFLFDMLPTLPTDPVSGYYTYITDSTGSRFTISANLSTGALSYSNGSGATTGAVDIDGNSYGAVTIGTQTWMTSNLMTTRYRNGVAIVHENSSGAWTSGTNNDHYSYPPTTANVETTLSDVTSNNLGFLYQQGAVLSSNGLCPSGWHVPSDAEFKTLVEYLGTAGCETTTGWQCSPAGASLKEAGTAHWNSGNTGTNTSGFSAVGTGYRYTDGSFFNRSVYTGLWSSSSTLDRYLYYAESRVHRDANSAAYGFSVRCLKD